MTTLEETDWYSRHGERALWGFRWPIQAVMFHTLFSLTEKRAGCPSVTAAPT